MLIIHVEAWNMKVYNKLHNYKWTRRKVTHLKLFEIPTNTFNILHIFTSLLYSHLWEKYCVLLLHNSSIIMMWLTVVDGKLFHTCIVQLVHVTHTYIQLQFALTTNYLQKWIVVVWTSLIWDFAGHCINCGTPSIEVFKVHSYRM